MPPATMHLRVLLPYEIFTDRPDITAIVVETACGSWGLLPQRLDCVAALVPGILQFTAGSEGEQFAAVDEGILVKAGRDVFLSVRRAIGGNDLGRLREAIEQEFLAQDQSERDARAVMTKMETGFLHQLVSLHHG